MAQTARVNVKFEAESGTRFGTVSLIDDVNASSGQGIMFSSSGTTISGARNAVLNHGTFVHGADSGGVARLGQLEDWLGRDFKYVSLNLGGNTWSNISSSSWGDYENTNPPNWSTRPDVTPTTNLSLNPGSLWLPPDEIRVGLQATANGAGDATYKRIADRMVAAGYGTAERPMYIRLGHEPNGGWYPWSYLGGNHDVYRDAYRHVAQYLKSRGPGFKLVYESGVAFPGGTAPSSSSIRDFESGYPGDDFVDVIGTNTYLNDPSRAKWLSDDKMRIEWVQQWAASRNKGFGIAEWGLWLPESGDADWYIRDMHALLSSFPATGPGRLVYNNYFWQDPKHQLNLGSTPRALAEYRRLFGTIPAQ